jgi:peptidoglycan DL-endopeptidase RipA
VLAAPSQPERTRPDLVTQRSRRAASVLVIAGVCAATVLAGTASASAPKLKDLGQAIAATASIRDAAATINAKIAAGDKLATLMLADYQTSLTEATALVPTEQADQATLTAATTPQDQATAQAALTSVQAQIAQDNLAAATDDASAIAAEHTDTTLGVTYRGDVADETKVLSAFVGGWEFANPVAAAALQAKYRTLAATVKHAAQPTDHGHWTSAIGQSVVDRAIQYLGTHYSWAAGSSHGRTYGVCMYSTPAHVPGYPAVGNSANDCHVFGFDCSGLALYSWAPYRPLIHYAASQYFQGSKHPSVKALLPGDLVFWSTDGHESGIHHVAIYVGDGNVIQSPQSGNLVEITPLAHVAEGYYGATRPA